MTSTKSSRKRTGKSYSDNVTSYELYYQLTYMSATAAAGIGRHRLFDLARHVPLPPSQYFDDVYGLVEHLRYNYPDACRLVGLRTKSEESKTFLLRLSDALGSGEPLVSFLAREAKVQGTNYANQYERELESLKKWSDAYTAVMVSVALVVVINLVSTMIYDAGASTMVGMVIGACLTGLMVAWVLSRAAPKEIVSERWSEGSEMQRRSIRLFRILAPAAVLASGALMLLGVDRGWIMILASFLLLPVGVVSSKADRETSKKDQEVSSFLRSLGGTATSRGTTLSEALKHIETNSFPTLEPDIRRLDLRLRAFAKPDMCWAQFAKEAGSRLIDQTTGVFCSAINLGGDPETSGALASEFAHQIAILRARRLAVAATFSWMTMIMHAVMAALMVFLLEIMKKFAEILGGAMTFEGADEAMASMAGRVMTFGAPPMGPLTLMVQGMVVALVLINAYAIMASEGGHLVKTTFHVSIMMLLSGIGLIVAPSLVQMVM